ncbi:ChaN family lipoprotein [Pseudorhodoferax sp.]|uniref:ChaN family lipoprotein n=1 Tax=Pseudorhodoferax sp. TaxID=1993553 RepID=UPI0039E280F2
MPAPTRSFPAALAAVLAAFLLAACATPPTDTRLQALLPADAILLGEQHDADAHHRIEAEVVRRLAARGQLAGLAVEMADAGRGTDGLPPQADEAAVRAALGWNDEAWPWMRYGPAVMAAVQAGVPVRGANLPRSAFGAAMRDAALDARLPAAALAAQHEAIRTGHCDLLPPAQIAPMARIQIARDQRMAGTVQALARPGRVVVLLAGSGHVDRRLGVPRHLPPGLQARAVRLLAGDAAEPSPAFDAVWTTPPLPPQDHCAALRQRLQR